MRNRPRGHPSITLVGVWWGRHALTLDNNSIFSLNCNLVVCVFRAFTSLSVRRGKGLSSYKKELSCRRMHFSHIFVFEGLVGRDQLLQYNNLIKTRFSFYKFSEYASKKFRYSFIGIKLGKTVYPWSNHKNTNFLCYSCRMF